MPMLKVRATQIVYYEGIRKPGDKNRAGQPLDEFMIKGEHEFNPTTMVAIGWEPKEKPPLDAFLEDGAIKPIELIVKERSDKLDAALADARARKVQAENSEFVESVQRPEKKKEKVL